MSQQSTSERSAGGPSSGSSVPPARTRSLSDGSTILVRAVVPGDRAELADRYEQLSPASRRSRFGSAPAHLSERRLDQLVDIDPVRRFALAAIATDEPGQPGVGVARYARSRLNPTEAEVAIVVLDSHQHRGIGAILLCDLAEVALANGITTFTATVTWESSDLIDTLRALGAVVHPAEPGIADVRMDLTDANRTRIPVPGEQTEDV
jgi:GNAT superfamily N-acetyltransferase